MIPASAPMGVMFAPRFEPMVVARTAGRRFAWEAAPAIGTKATVIGMLLRMFAANAEEMP